MIALFNYRFAQKQFRTLYHKETILLIAQNWIRVNLI